MMPQLSNHEISILQVMWEQKALAERTVTLDQLVSHLPDVPKEETIQTLKHLEARGLIVITEHTNGELFALNPLGAACARQLLDSRLGDLARAV
jgi:predicted transcriptional regulator